MMTTKVHSLCVVLVALAAAWPWGTASRATAEEMHYTFDFNDGTVPDSLNLFLGEIGDPVTPTLSCDASTGQLRIYDTVSAACGLHLWPDQFFSDTHISAVVSPDGGVFRGLPQMAARSSAPVGHQAPLDYYSCWLMPSTTWDGFVMGISKWVDGVQVQTDKTTLLPYLGPYLMEFDVVDGETVAGVGYTDLVARLSFNNGQQSTGLSLRDWGTEAYEDRLTSGYVSFGAGLGTWLRNDGWVLDVTLDDVNITATPVPEPATIALLLSGAASLVLWLRRRRETVPSGWRVADQLRCSF